MRVDIWCGIFGVFYMNMPHAQAVGPALDLSNLVSANDS